MSLQPHQPPQPSQEIRWVYALYRGEDLCLDIEPLATPSEAGLMRDRLHQQQGGVWTVQPISQSEFKAICMFFQLSADENQNKTLLHCFHAPRYQPSKAFISEQLALLSVRSSLAQDYFNYAVKNEYLTPEHAGWDLDLQPYHSYQPTLSLHDFALEQIRQISEMVFQRSIDPQALGEALQQSTGRRCKECSRLFNPDLEQESHEICYPCSMDYC